MDIAYRAFLALLTNADGHDVIFGFYKTLKAIAEEPAYVAVV